MWRQLIGEMVLYKKGFGSRNVVNKKERMAESSRTFTMKVLADVKDMDTVSVDAHNDPDQAGMLCACLHLSSTSQSLVVDLSDKRALNISPYTTCFSEKNVSGRRSWWRHHAIPAQAFQVDIATPGVSMATCTATPGVITGGEESDEMYARKRAGASYGSRQKVVERAPTRRAVSVQDAARCGEQSCRGLTIGGIWHAIDGDRMRRMLPCASYVESGRMEPNATKVLKRSLVGTVFIVQARVSPGLAVRGGLR